MNETTNAPVTPPDSNCVPPKKFERNEYGLICDGSVVYVYNDDGTINWRKMIKPEFLVPHKKWFQEKGLPVPETIDGLEDKQVLILLGGLKELAQTRGFESVSHVLTAPHENYVASVCSITWEPNYETRGESVKFSSIGDATPTNTSGVGKDFLAAIAENRAFCRAVRNFLKIHITAADEIGGNGTYESQPEDVSTALLREAMAKYNVSFEVVKAALIKDNVAGAEKFTGPQDISRFKQLELVERIKTKAAQKA